MTRPLRGDRKLKRSNSARLNLVQRLSGRRRPSEPSLRDARERTLVERVPTTISVVHQPSVITPVAGNGESAAEGFNETKGEVDVSMLTVEGDVPEVDSPESPFETWIHDADALLHSNEMSAFLASTGEVAMHATKTAVHVATLPVTVPFHVVSFTTEIVVGSCAHAVGSLCGAVDRVLRPTKSGERTASFHPVEGFLRNVTGVVPLLFHAVDQIKNDIGSTLLGTVTPALTDGEVRRTRSPIRRTTSSCAGESSAEQTAFLDRLRLDYQSSEASSTKGKVVTGPTKLPPKDGKVVPGPTETAAAATPGSPDVSKFLLRVCDLGLSLPTTGSRHERVYHIDLSKDYADEKLTMKALDALVEKGLALVSSCPEVEFGWQNPNSASLIDWKAENSTSKLLKRKSKLNQQDWISLLAREVLVWSGKLRSKDAHKADVPVFLSRGILPLSPRELLHLFWDDSRTSDYNKFSLGRSTSMEIEQGVANSHTAPPRGTKVVQSETQIPFTGFSVVMSTLMHARQIEEPEKCIVIVSRSLNPGRAGPHVGSKASPPDASKNELVWGVNLLRSVPNNPDLTDLTSVSQLSSSMVVQFLTHRVGIMAVESFFNAVRS